MLLLWRVAVFLALAAGICSAQQSELYIPADGEHTLLLPVSTFVEFCLNIDRTACVQSLYILFSVYKTWLKCFSPGCVATGGKTPGRPCVFPFTVRGKTYNSCTYDFSFVVGSKPWCSTKTDERGKHINGNVGTCEDPSCPIPPRG